MLVGKADTSRFAQALQQRAEDLAQAGARARRRAASSRAAPSRADAPNSDGLNADGRWRDAAYLWPFFAAE